MIVNFNSSALNLQNLTFVQFVGRQDGDMNVYYDNAKAGTPYQSSAIGHLKTKISEFNKKDGRFVWINDELVVNADKITHVYKNSEGELVVYSQGMSKVCKGLTDVQIERKYYELNSAMKKMPVSAQTQEAEAAAAAQKATQTVAQALTSLDSMVGCDRAKNEIKENLAFMQLDAAKKAIGVACESPARHMALLGNPGTGKTTFARKIAAIYHAAGIIKENKVVEVKRKDLIGNHIGDSEKKTNEAIEKAKGGILFIDEAYDLLPGGKDSNDFGPKVINTLVPVMEDMRDDLIIFFAGYRDETLKLIASNPGLSSRCPNKIEFDDYAGDELRKIMDLMLKARGLTISKEAAAKAMEIVEAHRVKCGKGEFANARDLRNLVEMAERKLAMRLQATKKIPSKITHKKRLEIQIQDLENIKLEPEKVKQERTVISGFGSRPQLAVSN